LSLDAFSTEKQVVFFSDGVAHTNEYTIQGMVYYVRGQMQADLRLVRLYVNILAHGTKAVLVEKVGNDLGRTIRSLALRGQTRGQNRSVPKPSGHRVLRLRTSPRAPNDAGSGDIS
jgi:hypothetical protein